MRIGLVLNILDEEYQISLYNGIRQRAEQLGIQIICFQEGNKTFVADSFIGCFPRKEYFNLDGIILLTPLFLITVCSVQKKTSLESGAIFL